MYGTFLQSLLFTVSVILLSQMLSSPLDFLKNLSIIFKLKALVLIVKIINILIINYDLYRYLHKYSIRVNSVILVSF